MPASSNTYVLGIRDRGLKGVDRNSAGPVILKMLAEGPRSFLELLSLTGLGQAELKDLMAGLVNDELIDGDEKEYSLTKLGYRAQLVVSS